MKIYLFILLLLFVGLIPANFIFAANPLDVVISEIAWMGTETSFADEWIELYNNTTSTIDITGWTLKSSDGSPNINFTTKIEQKTYSGHSVPIPVSFLIQGGGFYLMERTDDDTIKDITADFIYTGAMSNNGETLELRDANGNLIDIVDFTNDWLFGDNDTKQTMERINFLLPGNANNWQTSAEPGGTPHSPVILREPSAQSTERSATEESLPITADFPANIIINEILPSPDGPDAENEWIEIFNQNDFPVDISNWKITDTEGSIKSYSFPQNTIIKAKSFLLLPRPQTKITLNNDADGLNLIHPNGTITDSVVYAKAKLNQSYNRIDNDWTWSNTLTPGWKNIIPVADEKIGDALRPPVILREPSRATEESLTNAGNSGTNPEILRFAQNDEKSGDEAIFAFTCSLLSLFSAFSILALKRSMKSTYSSSR